MYAIISAHMVLQFAKNQGRALYGPIPVKTEAFREHLSAIRPYTNFGGKFVWTNHWSIAFPGEIRMDQWP